MPPAPFILQEYLRRLVLRLILMVDSVLAARMAGLRWRLAGLRAGHRHRARLEAELARAERCAALLAEPGFWDCPGAAGKAAEVARVAGDAGRRALARRVIWPVPVPRLSEIARTCAEPDPFGRCTGGVWGMAAGFAAAPLTRPSPPASGESGEPGVSWTTAEGRFRRRCCASARAMAGLGVGARRLRRRARGTKYRGAGALPLTGPAPCPDLSCLPGMTSHV